jgi:polyvinyl alcohol dehydrogenase (cytochrome)
LEIAKRAAAFLAAAIVLAGCGAPESNALPTPVPGEVWTTYRGDLGRDGHPFTATLDAAAAARLAVAWRIRLAGAVDGTPAVARGMVIAGSAGGELKAINAANGQTVWSRRALGAIAASPTISGDRVFVASLTGRIYSVDLLRGVNVWQWQGPVHAAIWASPVVYGDEVLVGVASAYGDQPLVPGRIFALDAATGHQRWTLCVQVNCQPGGGVWSTMATDENGFAYVGIGNPVDGVLAFDALTGERRWLSSLYADQGRDLDVGASPIVFRIGRDEVLAQATVQGLFAVLEAFDGTLLWQRAVVEGSAVHGLLASPAYDGTSLYVPSASPPTGLSALKPGDGSELWRYPTALPVYSAPAVGSGVVVFGTGEVLGDARAGSLVALSTADGRVLFSLDTHSAVRSGPAIAGQLVVFGDAAGDLFALRPKS